VHPLLHVYLLGKSEAQKQLKMGDLYKNSWAADPPDASSEILKLTLVAINAKLNTADFLKQFNPLLNHCNHLLHHCFQSLPIQLSDSSIRSPSIHLASYLLWDWSLNTYYFLSINVSCFCQFLKYIL
jgi:hypothetical protein